MNPSFSQDLLSLTKPRLSVLVILTAAGGFILAPAQEIDWLTGFFTVLGTTITVGSANTLNNYLERHTDQFMARTRNRPLPTGRIKPLIALIFGLSLSAIAIPMLTFLANPLAALIAAIGLLSYVLAYTPMKRSSSLNTLVGAIPGAIPPLIGWAGAMEQIDFGGWLLFALMFLWQIPHFLAISIYRKGEYEEAGLVMLPSTHGLSATRRQMLFYTFGLLPIPILLLATNVSGWATAIIGTALGIWWFAQAVDGVKNQRGPEWARKFFFASLIYLTVVFIVIGLDVLISIFQ